MKQKSSGYNNDKRGMLLNTKTIDSTNCYNYNDTYLQKMFIPQIRSGDFQKRQGKLLKRCQRN